MPELRTLDDASASRRLVEDPAPLLLVFGSPFCGGCRAFRELLANFEGPCEVAYVDAREGAGLIADLEVFHLPALILMREGEPIAELACRPQAEDLRRALIEALAGS